jgi:hypothetical protein
LTDLPTFAVGPQISVHDSVYSPSILIAFIDSLNTIRTTSITSM